LFFLIFTDFIAVKLSYRLELCQNYCLRIKWERGLGEFTQVEADLIFDFFGIVLFDLHGFYCCEAFTSLGAMSELLF